VNFIISTIARLAWTHNATAYKISAKSNNPEQSYCDLNMCPTNVSQILEVRGPNYTRFQETLASRDKIILRIRYVASFRNADD